MQQNIYCHQQSVGAQLLTNAEQNQDTWYQGGCSGCQVVYPARYQASCPGNNHPPNSSGAYLINNRDFETQKASVDSEIRRLQNFVPINKIFGVLAIILMIAQILFGVALISSKKVSINYHHSHPMFNQFGTWGAMIALIGVVFGVLSLVSFYKGIKAYESKDPVRMRNVHALYMILLIVNLSYLNCVFAGLFAYLMTTSSRLRDTFEKRSWIIAQISP